MISLSKSVDLVEVRETMLVDSTGDKMIIVKM